MTSGHSNVTGNDAPSVRDGRSKPFARPSIRWSVGRKTAVVIATAVFAGIAVQLFLQTNGMSEQLRERAIASSVSTTELLASQISGALKWKKSEVIGRAYTRLAADPNLTCLISLFITWVVRRSTNLPPTG